MIIFTYTELHDELRKLRQTKLLKLVARIEQLLAQMRPSDVLCVSDPHYSYMLKSIHELTSNAVTLHIVPMRGFDFIRNYMETDLLWFYDMHREVVDSLCEAFDITHSLSGQRIVTRHSIHAYVKHVLQPRYSDVALDIDSTVLKVYNRAYKQVDLYGITFYLIKE